MMPREMIEHRISGQIGHPAASMICIKLEFPAFENRATVNRIDRRGKSARKYRIGLDKRCIDSYYSKNLSPILVDKCVHRIRIGTVSRPFQSLFCCAIKKCAATLMYIKQCVENILPVEIEVDRKSVANFVATVDEADN